MTDQIEDRIRQIVREELEKLEASGTWTTRRPPVMASHARIEMPLRSGEVERHYPVAEVARLLGMSRCWVYDRINDGTFVVANFGDGKSKRRIPASSINAFVLANTYGP